MKRTLILFLLMLGFAGVVHSQSASNIGTETILNRIFNSGNNALNATITGDITLENGEKISNSTDGIICLEGGGGTNNEDLCFDLESDANDVVMTSTTSVGSLKWGSIGHSVSDNVAYVFGSGIDFKMNWDNGANDSMQFGTAVGAAGTSGYVSLMEFTDLGDANREPSGTSADPVLRGYSSDATVATDYWEFTHNQTHPIIGFGTGNWHIKATGTEEVPNLTNCGTSPSISGNPNVGIITVGTGTVTTCTATFDTPFSTNDPSCTIAGDSTAITYAVTSDDTTNFVISSSATMASDVIKYNCWGY